MGQLDERRIIITGGSQGIGFAAAEKCASEGANVILCARSHADLNNAASRLPGGSSKDHRIYALDVGNLNEVQEFATWVKKEKLSINGVVNCAGVYGPIGKTTDVNLADFAKTLQINFLGTVYMCSIFAPLLMSRGRKKIINFSGGGAASPFPNYSAYATSKVAIVRFTENLALELLPDGVDVNCIAPGFVITRLHQQTIDAGTKSVGDAFYETTKKQIEAGGIPPEKAAALASFLLSTDSDGITGKFISAPWDPWDTAAFQRQLREDRDVATLRRIDNKSFFKKN
jgi:3-oxoacyl-[acyl-carrier protein] reductase